MKENENLRKLVALYLTVLLLGLPGISQADTEFERIFIFGDSLSDPGNLYLLTGETSEAPYVLIPAAPYSIKGHQFTNGKTWVQRFARKMDLKKGGKAALKKPGKYGNYAFGGALARIDSGSPAPDATTQINMFLGDYESADNDDDDHEEHHDY